MYFLLLMVGFADIFDCQYTFGDWGEVDGRQDQDQAQIRAGQALWTTR